MTRSRRGILRLGSLFVLLSFFFYALHRDRILKFYVKNQDKNNWTRMFSVVVPELCPFFDGHNRL